MMKRRHRHPEHGLPPLPRCEECGSLSHSTREHSEEIVEEEREEFEERQRRAAPGKQEERR